MTNLVIYFTLVLSRVGAFVVVLPLFGSLNVPRMVKAGLALALTTMWFGAITAALPSELFDRPIMTSWFSFGLAVGREVVFGAFLGYAFGLFQVPARVAGEFLTQELGLTFGAFINPTGESNVSSLTQMIDILGIVLFFGLDGHHLFLGALHASFARLPVGSTLPGVPVQDLVQGLALTEEWGLVLAGPMALCLFVVTIGLTLMTRAAPQINLFSVGFPLRLAAGLVVVFLLMPDFLTSLSNVLQRFGDLLLRLV